MHFSFKQSACHKMQHTAFKNTTFHRFCVLAAAVCNVQLCLYHRSRKLPRGTQKNVRRDMVCTCAAELQHSGTEPDVTSSVPVATSEGPKSAAGVLVGEHVSQLAQLQAASHPGGLPQADQPPSGGPAIASLQPANPPAVLNVISQAEVRLFVAICTCTQTDCVPFSC